MGFNKWNIRWITLQVLILFVIGLQTFETRAQTSASENVTDIPVFLAQGDSAFAQFNNAQAASYYKKAIALDSTNFRALSKLSQVYTTQSKDLIDQEKKTEAKIVVDESVRLVDMMLRLYPDRVETQYQLAAAYGNYALFKGGKTKLKVGRRIEGYCLKAIELDPDYAPPYMVLGIFYRKIAELSWIERTLAKTLLGGLPQGGREKSESYLVQAIERDPEMILGWYELAVTRLSMDNDEMALTALEKAVTLAPESSNDLHTLELVRQLLTEKYDR